MWQADYLAREQKHFNWQLQIILGIIVVAFTFLACRLFFLQIIRRQALLAISEQNRTQLYVEQANRGYIYDRRGEILADIQPAFSVTFSRLNIDDEKLAVEIGELSALLNIPSQDIWGMINALKGYPFEVLQLAKNISRETLLKLVEEIPNLPGINVQVVPQRRYPKSQVVCHVLGYIGEISKEELKTNFFDEEYRLGDWIGKTGIEKKYDSWLRGQDGGSQIEVDAHGRQQRVIQRIEPVPGDNLVLTIDYSIQKLAEEGLAGKSGAVVAIDPSNGEVLALASSPVYDPNIFVQKENRELIDKTLTDKINYPLLNRAISGTYAPGSIFKAITALAGLEKGVDPERKVNCPGYFFLGEEKRKFRCWNAKGHGRVGLIDAMAFSCDVYFYHLGLIVGSDLLEDWAKSFGLGSPTGIDLPSEKGGLVAGKVWKKKYQRTGWFHGDTVNMAIGQGFFLNTPLQAAMMVSSVANGGKVYRPYLVKKIVNQNEEVVKEFYPQLIRNVEMDMRNLRIVQQGMTAVVTYGTGRTAAVQGTSVGGKTGSAQNPQGEPNAWFVAYAPVEYPRIAVSVIVEHGGSGGAAAAPIAAKIITEYLKNKPQVLR